MPDSVDSLIPRPGGPDRASLIGASPPTPPAPSPEGPALRAFGDVRATRAAIYDQVHKAVSGMAPVENQRYRLRVTDPHWVDPETFPKARHKQAILSGRSLGRRIAGTWVMEDVETGQEVGRRKATLFSVPYLTDNGTWVYNGNEYGLRNQQRLLPGVYVRRKANDEVEAHVNVLSGGPGHHIFMDPASSLFYLRLGQGRVPLLPVMRAMGATDEEIRESWGDEVFSANAQQGDGGAVSRLVDRLVRTPDPDLSQEQQLRAAFERMTLDPYVTRHTLGRAHDHITKDTFLDTTRKVLGVNRGEADTDDRDHLAYQRFVGPEDLFSERITKDRAGVLRQLLFKLTNSGSLDKLPSGALQDWMDATLLESRLGAALEETNPTEMLDKLTQVSRMGEGGIGSLDAIPEESRGVQPSQMGFVDPVRTPESLAAGVDLFMASNSRKGDDGRIYSQFTDLKTGQMVWKSPQDLADQVITFPGALDRFGKRIPAIQDGKLSWVPRNRARYVLPVFENAYSALGNMVPLKSMVKGQRISMSSRMLTQALSLNDGEAPLVQNAIPGTGGRESYEDRYGTHMGAIRADRGGRVVSVRPDALVVRYDDGERAEVELHNDFPYNRKSFLTQTPAVRPGQRFAPGELLARSNYTDRTGSTALGMNVRTAYVPWGGKNFEDAFVISESLARKLTSRHMYQHQLSTNDRTRTGKNTYISLFPGKYDKATLAKLDDQGRVRPGTVVHQGDPLILGAEERARTRNKLHRRGESAFSDVTVTWDRTDPGLVTDVVDARGGPLVVVSSENITQVGDKLCFDPQTEILTRDRGWVPVAGVTLSDEVATLDKGGYLAWQRPTHIWTYAHRGPMYRLVNQDLDMLVTLDHRLWAAKPGEPFRGVTAREVHQSRSDWVFQKDCKWRGRERAFIALPSNGFSSRKGHAVPGRVRMDDWLAFLGHYLARGWRGDAASGPHHVGIGRFRAPPRWREVRDVLGRLGLLAGSGGSADSADSAASGGAKDTEGDKGRIVLDNPWLHSQLAGLDEERTKRVPAFVQDLSSRQIRIFLDAYLGGAGAYTTSSRRLAEDLQLLCLKVGWCATVREVPGVGGRGRAPRWRGGIRRKRTRPRRGRPKREADAGTGGGEAVVDYDGMVYCVTVPNHTLYVKRRCQTYWSQNSGRYG